MSVYRDPRSPFWQFNFQIDGRSLHARRVSMANS
jgi:hypothetical protein